MLTVAENSLGTDAIVGLKEFEIKFSLAPRSLSRLFELQLLDQCSFGRSQTLQTIYFDTNDGCLVAEGITLRWRKHGKHKPVMTLKFSSKSGSTLFERTEIEIPADANGINLNLFDEAIAAHLRDIIAGRDLIARYETRFKRRTNLVTTKVSSYEIAIDEGSFIVGDQKWPLRELELELKSGDWAEMLDFARKLVVKTQLQLELTSKSERCFILAGLPPLAKKAPRLSFRADMQLDAVIATVLNTALKHFTDYIQPFRDGDDARAIHQMRVGLRHLRAALKVFAREFSDASFASFSARAREIANGLSLARECDAFHDLAFGDAFAHRNCPKDAVHLQASLSRLREKAYADARAIIDSAETALFIIDLHAYIAKRGWRNEISDLQLHQLTDPCEHFARGVLQRLFDKAKKRGKNFLGKSDEERHEFRIALKNLRYTGQFFSSLFRNQKSYKVWNDALVDLQESLGIQNDLASAQAMLTRLDGVSHDPFPYASGFLLGWYASKGALAEAKIAKQWKAVRKLPRFWD